MAAREDVSELTSLAAALAQRLDRGLAALPILERQLTVLNHRARAARQRSGGWRRQAMLLPSIGLVAILLGVLLLPAAIRVGQALGVGGGAAEMTTEIRLGR
jgi:hypothetical protein